MPRACVAARRFGPSSPSHTKIDASRRSATTSAPQVTVSYQTHIFDRYNWDGGKAVTIGPITITDERLGQLHEVGIAQEYDVFGTSDAQEFSYEYDPAGTTPTTEIDPSNGDGR